MCGSVDYFVCIFPCVHVDRVFDMGDNGLGTFLCTMHMHTIVLSLVGILRLQFCASGESLWSVKPPHEYCSRMRTA